MRRACAPALSKNARITPAHSACAPDARLHFLKLIAAGVPGDVAFAWLLSAYHSRPVACQASVRLGDSRVLLSPASVSMKYLDPSLSFTDAIFGPAINWV